MYTRDGNTQDTDLGCAAQPTIYETARAAWENIQTEDGFTDWLAIGPAIVEIQAAAMVAARTNRPVGYRYQHEVGARLRSEGLDAIDKSTRSRLVEVMRHRDEIVVWHAALPLAKRLKLNHPMRVLSAWKRACAPPVKKQVATPKAMPTDGSVEAIGRYIETLSLSADRVRTLLSQAPEFRATIEKIVRGLWIRQSKTKKKNARLAKKAAKATKAKKNTPALTPTAAGNDVPTEASAIARKALNEMRAGATPAADSALH